jgi:hypothetical protein
MACSKLGAVPRLVALLDRSVPLDIASMAVSALSQLVLKDVNRLKCWRSGGIEKLKAMVDRGLPRVSDVAQESVRVLMAGPRIDPAARFTTASGRKLNAEEMRLAIHRLNLQDTFLSGVNMSMTALHATQPRAMAAVVKRPQSCRSHLENVQSKRAAGSKRVGMGRARFPTHDFLPPRPHTAATVRPTEHCGMFMNGCVSAVGPLTSRSAPTEPLHTGRSLIVPPPDPKSFCSDFRLRLTQSQEHALCDRLVYSSGRRMQPVLGNSKGRGMLSRNLSTWDKPADIVAKPRGSGPPTRQSVRFYSAMASRKYRTETGTVICSTDIEKGVQRMSAACR